MVFSADPWSKCGFAAAALLLALALGACSERAPPPPEPSLSLSAYRIGAGDRIKITILEHDDLGVEVDVADDGTIEVPLVGSVRAAGSAAPDLRAILTERFARDYIKDPKVNVEVIEFRPFYVLGQVNKPGSYPFVPDIDIRRAVAVAGGFTRRADVDGAILVRESTGERSLTRVGLGTPVFPGDVIEIDRRLF